MNLVKFLQNAIVLDRTVQIDYPAFQRTFNNIEIAIQEAWNTWDDDVISTYLTPEGEKPAEPTRDFSLQWLANEDLEADGYNIEAMCEVFKVSKV